MRIAFAAALIAVAALTSKAEAAGALAIYQGPNGAWSYNVVWDADTPEDARRQAIRNCNREAQRAHGASGCRLITEFEGICFALAFMNDGFNGYGWSRQPQLNVARRNALSECQSRRGGETCRIVEAVCDDGG